MIDVDFEELLHKRIITSCRKLFTDREYKHASHEAMTQVEIALKEKSGVKNKFGVNLCRSLFGGPKSKGIKLRVPFGNEMQEQAARFFEGAFSYYRNYAVHDGENIDKRICIRILIMASDLLDLIAASPRSFTEIGGVEGLIKEGIFTERKDLLSLLRFLDGYACPDDVFDGFLEDLAFKGFNDSQLQALFDTGLVEYMVESYGPHLFEQPHDPFASEDLGCFRLTTLGKEIVGN